MGWKYRAAQKANRLIDCDRRWPKSRCTSGKTPKRADRWVDILELPLDTTDRGSADPEGEAAPRSAGDDRAPTPSYEIGTDPRSPALSLTRNDKSLDNLAGLCL